MIEARLASKSQAQHKTTVHIGNGITCGGTEILVVAGPCSVESAAQMDKVSAKLSRGGIHALRGGVFKPRTSPYAFQGLGEEGLILLQQARALSGMPIITEVMSIEQIDLVARYADVLQVGSRNMQNFELLKALGHQTKPILLKRGLSATIEEFLMAAEYILSNGNPNVILCERGIRSFDGFTRNVLDLGAVAALKQITHLPIIADPSHAAGKHELVADLARAAIACGADGVMVECHPEPEKSVSDARQALSLDEALSLSESLRAVAGVVGRKLTKNDNSQLSSFPFGHNSVKLRSASVSL
jgi:3-deoxy-7-phosphoheptulonate synthase